MPTTNLKASEGTPLVNLAADLSACQRGYPDLEFLEPIKISKHRGVYRAVSRKYGPCIVKVTSSTATQVEVSLLRNEFNKLKMCNSENIVTVYDIYEHQSTLGVAMLLQDCGQSLLKWLRQSNNILSIQTVIEIGIQVADGLDHLHRHARLIHSDLNPNNVCYDEATKRACIIDLGGSHGFAESFTMVTPAYQSPEQARGATDHRSDLYSLGVLLFQLYTQQIPIQAASSKAYRLAHILDPPLVVSSVRECHPMFDSLIARLLAKSPDERYLTAAGLKYDLSQLLALVKTDASGLMRFEMGTREAPFILTLPGELIGRSEELAAIEEMYKKCLDPETSGFCYLEGKPGVGKSALVQAFAAKQHNPFYFSYKFNQLGNTPLQAIIHIMSRLVHQTIMSEQFLDDTLRAEFLERLCESDVLRGLVDVVPAYAKLISATKPIPEGLAGDVRRILYPAIVHVFAETRKFCQAPIIVFFDDVQWIDPGTKGVLSYLLGNNVPILLIIAFRDRSSQSTFTMESLLNAGNTATSMIQPVGISLREFSEEYVIELISHLALSDEDKDTLARTLYKQTEGNPFFIGFRLSTMADTGALAYDVDAKLWRLDKSRVSQNVEVVSEDAVEQCVAVLRTLDQEVSSVLCRLAMLPQGCSVDELASILEHEEGLATLAKSKSCTVTEIIHQAVTFAVQKSLVCHKGTGFCFAHDRLQQGALKCVSTEEAVRIHYYLGKQALPVGEYTSEQAYRVLHHFSKSTDLVTDPDLILRIGSLAVETCAFYVTSGSQELLDATLCYVRELLQKVDDETKSSDSFLKLDVRLLIAHHRIKFLMNDLETADAMFDSMRPRLKSSEEIHDAYHARISLLINSSRHREAIEATAEALSLLGEQSLPPRLVLPDGQPASLVGEVSQQIKNIFSENIDWNAEKVANSLPVSTDEDHNFRTETIVSCIPSMYLTGRFDLYIYVPALACRDILKNGITRSAGNAFSVLGFALVAVFGDSFGAQVAMLGKHIADRFDNDVCKCRAYCHTGIAVIYDKRFQDLASPLLYASYAAGRTAHDILWACYGSYVLSAMLMFEGIALPKVFDTLEGVYAYAVSDGHQDLAQRTLRCTLHVVSILAQGTSKEPPVLHFSIPSDEITKSQPLLAFSHGTISLVALYFERRYEIAWKIISEIITNGLDKSSPGLPHMYIFQIYTVVVAHALLVDVKPSESEGEAHSMSEHVRLKVKEVMKASSESLANLNKMAPVFTPYARLAKACMVDIFEDRPLDALQIFESVVSYVSTERPGKHLDVVAICYQISANICDRAKLPTAKPVYCAKALVALEKWGGHSVVERFVKESEIVNGVFGMGHAASFRMGSNGQDPPHSSTTPSSNVHASASDFGSTLRTRPDYFASVLESARYITSFSSFDELTGKLTSSLLKQATATRLLLLMPDPETGALEPVAQSTRTGQSRVDTLLNERYCTAIVKITQQLHEPVVVHSAQQESPYCFESYIQESGVSSVASIPVMNRDSLVAIVYMEHQFSEGVFVREIMETMVLLGHHVASAIVNTRLLRDDRRRAAQLEQSHAFLAKAVRVKDTILSNTSHELRSPLAGIIGLNEHILTSGIDLDQEVQTCLETTLAMARQLLGLVSDILDMSKIGEGILRLHYETTSLYSLVKDVLDVSKFTVNGIDLINTVSESFPAVMVDPARITQILFNLVSNAIKFTPEGSVTVSCELLDDRSMFMVSVTDTGIGIDQAHLDVVFQAFGRVELYETRQHQGAGLGLSITKQLVLLHGGHIEVLSKVGEGSTFQVFIPMTPPDQFTKPETGGDAPLLRRNSFTGQMPSSTLNKPQTANGSRMKAEKISLPESKKEAPIGNSPLLPAVQLTGAEGTQAASKVQHQDGTTPNEVARSTTPAKPIADQTQNRKERELHPSDSILTAPLRVLAVDDTLLNLKIVSNFLRKTNTVVTTATNGKQLLEKISGSQWIDFDVILLDWMMPIMDGITACRILRQTIPHDLLPVIFLTAKSDPADMTKGFDAGGCDFAMKPLNRHEVLARTFYHGQASRRARARYFDAVPTALFILSKEPFWQMRDASDSMPMFVISICCSGSSTLGGIPAIDGPLFLRFFRLAKLTADSDWQFYAVGEYSVTFLAAHTDVHEITKFIRAVLAEWAEAQVAQSVSVSSPPGNNPSGRPLITVGVDHRRVRAHLFAERKPMLATVEACVSVAQVLAGKGTTHEEVLLSETAQIAMETNPM